MFSPFFQAFLKHFEANSIMFHPFSALSKARERAKPLGAGFQLPFRALQLTLQRPMPLSPAALRPRSHLNYTSLHIYIHIKYMI